MTLPAELVERLRDLLVRVEKCEGADREIDAALCEALCYPPLTDNDAGIGITMEGHEDGSLTYYAGKRKTHKGHAPRLTESIDAAIGLVEKVLPGDAYWHLDKSRDGYTGYCGPWGQPVRGSAATPALALLAALLRSIQGEK